MTQFDSFTQFILRFTNRRWIFTFSLIIAVAGYYYVVNHVYKEDNDFLTSVFKKLCCSEEYKFYGGNKNGGDYSTYFNIGKALEFESTYENFKINPVYGENNALGNAFGVLNSSKSFGLIQSDTYLQANFLKNTDRIRFISDVYMERLHILIKSDSAQEENGRFFLSNGDVSDKLIKAFENGRVMTGGPNSSARNYTYMILNAIKDLSEKKNLSNEYIKYGSIKEIFEFMEDNDPKNNEIYVGIFTLGYNEKVNDLLEDEHYSLIGIDPFITNEINKNYGQDLIVTYFDNIYRKGTSLPSFGVYARLIASADITDSDISNFLKVFSRVGKKKSDLERIFQNPEITLSELSKYYKRSAEKQMLSLFESFLVFITSVIVSTFLIMNFIMWFASNYRKANYYRRMIKDYNAVLDISEVYIGIEAKVENLYSGLKNLGQLAYDIRKDFESGGMMNSDHEYLMTNLDKIYDFYRERLSQRFNDLIEKISGESSKEPKYTKDYILSELNLAYGQDYLFRNDYDFLYQKAKNK